MREPCIAYAEGDCISHEEPIEDWCETCLEEGWEQADSEELHGRR